MSSRRFEGIDVARAVAVFGMVLVNFRVVLVAADRETWLERVADATTGRAAGLFVILAGMGMAMMAARAESPQGRHSVRLRLFRRATFLFVAGLLYYGLWPGDILHFYGVYLSLGALCLWFPDRWLWATAAALSGAFVVMLLTLDYSAEWDWVSLHYAGFWTPSGFIRNLFYNGFHPVVPWLALLLYGLWLGRRVHSRRVSNTRLVAVGLSAALAAELLSRVLIQRFGGGEDVRAIFGTGPIPPMPLYLVAASGLATAVIGVCLAATERWPDAPPLGWLAATGRLALTLYVAHVVVGMAGFHAAGLDRDSALGMVWAWVFIALAVAFSVRWLRGHSRGPLEAAMRRFT